MGDLTPLSNIMDRYLEDLKSGKAAEDFRIEETAYRRGYDQAYDRALIDIFGLLRQGMTIEDAYRMATLHADLIGDWRAKQRDQFIEPPRFEKMSLLETLEYRRSLQRGDEVD